MPRKRITTAIDPSILKERTPEEEEARFPLRVVEMVNPLQVPFYEAHRVDAKPGGSLTEFLERLNQDPNQVIVAVIPNDHGWAQIITQTMKEPGE